MIGNQYVSYFYYIQEVLGPVGPQLLVGGPLGQFGLLDFILRTHATMHEIVKNPKQIHPEIQKNQFCEDSRLR